MKRNSTPWLGIQQQLLWIRHDFICIFNYLNIDKTVDGAIICIWIALIYSRLLICKVRTVYFDQQLRQCELNWKCMAVSKWTWQMKTSCLVRWLFLRKQNMWFHIDIIKLMLALMKAANFISNSTDCASELPSGWNNEIGFKGRDQRLGWTNEVYQDTLWIPIGKQTLQLSSQL